MAETELENLEAKLDELVKICLELDQLGVKLRELKPGSREYALVLRQIESGGRAVKAKAAVIEEIVEGLNGSNGDRG